MRSAGNYLNPYFLGWLKRHVKMKPNFKAISERTPCERGPVGNAILLLGEEYLDEVLENVGPTVVLNLYWIWPRIMRTWPPETWKPYPPFVGMIGLFITRLIVTLLHEITHAYLSRRWIAVMDESHEHWTSFIRGVVYWTKKRD